MTPRRETVGGESGGAVAPVFDISRASLHDGPGIRTVVYLKGCPLRCRWCHNPEGLSPQPELMFNKERCIGCGRCAEVCKTGHMMAGGRMELARGEHGALFACADVCPNMALRVCGLPMTVGELLPELTKDAHFYGNNGGVTFSGGECLLYPDYVAAAAAACQDMGIHTCVESSLAVPWENIEAVAPKIKLFLADLKHRDGEAHKRLTGADNSLILSNLERLARLDTEIWVRIPLIPGFNDSPEELLASAEIANAIGGSIKRVELLKYNNLAKSKYASLGRRMQAPSARPQSEAVMEKLNELMAGALREEIELVR